MQLDVWHIAGNRFHFGTHGLGQEKTAHTWHSDSLFAALIARLALLQGDAAVQSFIAPFYDGKPPLVISSTFPLAGRVRFFPTPLAALAGETPEGLRFKDLKKAAWVSEALYRECINGKPLAEFASQAATLQGKRLWYLPEEKASLPEHLRSSTGEVFKTERQPRVCIGRADNNSTLFFTGSTHFAQDCGLWFAVRWLQPDATLQSLLANLLQELAEAGLGAERSVGFGKAAISLDGKIELPEPAGGLWTSLSRYLPTAEETPAMQHAHAVYQLERVGGWLDSHQTRGQRRLALNLIAPGAVLGAVPSQAPGQVADVRPRYPSEQTPFPHPVYRNGIALAVAYGGAA